MNRNDSAERLYRAIGMIDEKFIEEAYTDMNPDKGKKNFRKIFHKGLTKGFRVV